MLRRIARIDGTRLGIGLGVVIVVFGVMGALFIRDSTFIHEGWVGSVHLFGRHIRGFNLDGEMNLPTAFSGLLLVAACLCGIIVATESSSVELPPPRLVPVALLIGYMSLDEVWQFHERLQTWTGVNWEALYLPVFAFAGIIGLNLLPQLRRCGRAGQLFLLGGAAWGVAQVIEYFQWNGRYDLVAPWSIVPEETLEMTGSLLFLLAFLAVARHIVATRDSGQAARLRNRAISAGVRPRAGARLEPTPSARPRSPVPH